MHTSVHISVVLTVELEVDKNLSAFHTLLFVLSSILSPSVNNEIFHVSLKSTNSDDEQL